MNFKKVKTIFTKHLLLIALGLPLFVVIFYGVTISLILKHRHDSYTKQEISRYEEELKEKHKLFLKEKAKYIELFINVLYEEALGESKALFIEKIINFIDSLKKYDSGFIFIFDKNGTLIKHPCAKKFIGFDNEYNRSKKNTIVKKFIEASTSNKYVYYDGLDCNKEEILSKVAYVQHIKETDLYIVISKNEKDIALSIDAQKKIWQEKFEDESDNNMQLLFIAIVLSILLSLLFSKTLNRIILDYEKELKNNNKVMFAQSRLAQAGELLSMISHQWRQPISKIASISTNLRFKLMIENEIPKDFLDKKFEEIEEYTEFLSKTIDDFKEFYKPKHSKELSYLIPLIEKSIDFLENSIHKKKVIIKKHFDKDCQLLIYPNELIQVIVNIIQNAIEFSSRNGTVKIVTRIQKNAYIIYIKDYAGGIKDEYIEKIFDAHFSTKSSSNTNNLGLGLYVSKVIVETHFHGKLSVSSTGICSIFTIRLPR